MERHPSKPTFHIFPYKTVENVAKQTVYMINRKWVRLEGWPVGGSYSINILACPGGSTRSIRANQSMRQCYFRRSEHARALLARAKGSTPFSHIKSWLGWAGDDDSLYKRGLRREKVNFFCVLENFNAEQGITIRARAWFPHQPDFYGVAGLLQK